jgi:flavin reductase (DIM6/NTAB) family NADH-FMN oxidoreductase RutF
MECRLVQLVERPGGSSITLVLAEVLRYHVDEDLLLSDGTLDPELLKPLARLGGTRYGRVRDVFSLPRP